MKVKGGSLRSRWEQQIWKDVTQKEGRTWEEIGDEELWTDKDRWRGLVSDDPHKVEMS
jgi:hypothetical protein